MSTQYELINQIQIFLWYVGFTGFIYMSCYVIMFICIINNSTIILFNTTVVTFVCESDASEGELNLHNQIL